MFNDWAFWVPVIIGVSALVGLHRIGKQLEAIHAAILRGQGIDDDDEYPL